jgi:hypothetical protein
MHETIGLMRGLGIDPMSESSVPRCFGFGHEGCSVGHVGLVVDVGVFGVLEVIPSSAVFGLLGIDF